jgi:hypothetical protein
MKLIKRRILSVFLAVVMVMSVVVPITVTPVSANTEINYARLLQTSLYFFDANMCGPDVATRSHFTWRNNCHLQDNNYTIPSNLGGGTVDLSGGFHDAGDHVKFNLPIAYAGVTVGWAVREYRADFDRIGATTHAKRILDHFAEYFKKCTILDTSGNIRAYAYQVGDGGDWNDWRDHGFWGPPETQTGSARGAARRAYFTGANGTDQIAMASAVLAANFVNFGNPEDLEYAIKLFNWANDSPSKGRVQLDGFYVSSRWEDKLALAGEWLVIATGNNSYRRPISGFTHHTTEPMTWDGVWQQAVALRGDDWNTVRNQYLQRANTSAPNTYVRPHAWGGARHNNALQGLALYYARKVPGNDAYATWAHGQMRFLLGANPRNNTYVMGYPTIGTGNPQDSGAHGQNLRVHHRAATGFTGNNAWNQFNSNAQPLNLLTGGLIGGPAPNGDYNNNYNDFQYSEVACDYNANLIFASAGHLSRNPTHQPVPVSDIPGGPFRNLGGGIPPPTCPTHPGQTLPCTICSQPPTCPIHPGQQLPCSICELPPQCPSHPGQALPCTICSQQQTGALFDMQITPSAEAFARLTGNSSSGSASENDVLRRNGSAELQVTANAGPPRTITVSNRGGGTSQGVQILPGNITGINSSSEYTITVTGSFNGDFAGVQARLRSESGSSSPQISVPAPVGADGSFTITHTLSGARLIADAGGRYSIGNEGGLTNPNMTITGIVVAEAGANVCLHPNRQPNDCTRCADCTVIGLTQNCSAPSLCPAHTTTDPCENGHDSSGPAATCTTPQICARSNCSFQIEAPLQHQPNTAVDCTQCMRNGCTDVLSQSCSAPSLCPAHTIGDDCENGHDTSGSVATCTTAQVCARSNCSFQISPHLGHQPNMTANCTQCTRNNCTSVLPQSCSSPNLCTAHGSTTNPCDNGHDNSGAPATCTTAQICARSNCTFQISPPLGHQPNMTANCTQCTRNNCTAVLPQSCQAGSLCTVHSSTTNPCDNGHDNSGAPATCTTAQICARSNCSVQIAPPLGHDSVAGALATCTTPQICARNNCTFQVSPQLGHQPDMTANCTECMRNNCNAVLPVTCSAPNNCTAHTTGNDCANGHDTSGVAATCTTAQICARSNCSFQIAAPLGHDNSGAAATCTTAQVCARSNCTVQISPPLGHQPNMTANCTQCMRNNCTAVLPQSCQSGSLCAHHTQGDEFILGDINGDEAITILDVLELLKFLAKISDNAIDKAGGEGSPAWNAAIINPPLSQGQRRPTIGDALEILKKLAKIPNKIDNPE